MRQRRRRGGWPLLLRSALILLQLMGTVLGGGSDSYVRPPVMAQSDPIRPANIREAPRINAVSAMCSSDGITASLSFDRPFNGKIYSRDYSTVPECIYYAGAGQHTVLFSIGSHKCGTKLTRTTRNVIDQMENRVYVQMDKDTQTSADKQFAFVCQLAAGEADIARGENGTKKEAYNLPPAPIVPAYTSQPFLASSDGVRRAPESGSYVTAAPSYQRNEVAPQGDPIIPVNTDNVRRVAAISRDSHFGNWPIPGSKPFSHDMKPVVSWPQGPVVAPVAPVPSESYAVTPWYARPMFSHSLEPVHAATSSRPAFTFPLLTPATPPPRAPPMPSHLRPSADYVRPELPRTAQRAEPYRPSESVHPFLFSPLVGVRTEPIAFGGDRESEARPWNDARVKPALSSSSSKDWTGGRYVTAPAGNEVVGHWPPEDSHTRATISPGQAYAAHEADAMGIEIEKDKERQLSQGATTETVLPAGTADGSITRDFTTPPPKVSESIDVDDSANRNRIDIDITEPKTDRMVASQDPAAVNSAVFLEIQQGSGPHAATIARPVKIGDNITLVVRSNGLLKGENDFDMFVHSCFATDGPGTSKIELIDKNGCVTRPQVAGPLQRIKESNGQQLYFFKISAFKFPGPDDVYFSCSVDMTPGHRAPDICRSGTSRKRRELLSVAINDGSANTLRLFDTLKVRVPDEVGDDYGRTPRTGREAHGSWSESGEGLRCLDASTIAIAATAIGVLVVALLSVSILAVHFYSKLSAMQAAKIY